MKPMQIAMALLSAVMFFILAGVFMGVQLELNGTNWWSIPPPIFAGSGSSSVPRWSFLPAAAALFQKAVKNVSGPKFIMPAIDGSTVKQKLFLIALLVIAVARRLWCRAARWISPP